MHKRIVAIVFAIVISLTSIIALADQASDALETSKVKPTPKPPSIDYANWMVRVNPNALVYTLDLLGTHDSSTYKADNNSAWQCQRANITTQLNWGVRVLDIRLKMNEKVDSKRNFRSLLTAHGSHTYEPFDDILNYCMNFLNAHPGETIIMMIKDEGSPKVSSGPNFNDSFEWYLKACCNRYGFANVDDKFPDTSNGKLCRISMEQARGKILLFSRYGDGGAIARSQQTMWADNSSSANGLTGSSSPARISDNYKALSAAKIRALEEDVVTIDKTNPGGRRYDLLIKFLSSAAALPITTASNNIPAYVNAHKYRDNKRYGWFMMDFVNGYASDKDGQLRDQMILFSINDPRAFK